jgi:hypothetical protein
MPTDGSVARHLPYQSGVERRLNPTAFILVAAGVLILIMVGVAFRVYRLTAQSLWYDEGSSLYYSGGMSLEDTLFRIAYSNASERFQVF